MLFKSHYGFDAFYCDPGIKGAHEKGGIEGKVGRFRRNFLTPVPAVATLAELNDKLRVWDDAEDRRRISQRLRTIGQDFAAEQPLLALLPAEGFDPGLVLTPRVDRCSLITVRSTKYSVPVRFINRKVRVSLQATQVRIRDGRALIATHPRTEARGGQGVRLDHYLEVLKFKPAPRHWRRPGGRGCSPRPTTHYVPLPARPTETPPPPANSSTSCSCTGPWTTQT